MKYCFVKISFQLLLVQTRPVHSKSHLINPCCLSKQVTLRCFHELLLKRFTYVVVLHSGSFFGRSSLNTSIPALNWYNGINYQILTIAQLGLCDQINTTWKFQAAAMLTSWASLLRIARVAISRYRRFPRLVNKLFFFYRIFWTNQLDSVHNSSERIGFIMSWKTSERNV